MVLNKSERVTDVNFLIDDGTGRIECNRWYTTATTLSTPVYFFSYVVGWLVGFTIMCVIMF